MEFASWRVSTKMEPRRDILKRILVYIFIFGFTLAPLYFVFSLSVQTDPPYSVVPNSIDWSSYARLFSNLHDIRASMSFSLRACLLGTTVGLLLAIVTSYLIIAMPTTLRTRQRLLQLAVGIYLLPAFAMYPALSLLPLTPTTDLVVVFAINSFALCLLLLLFIFSSMAQSSFEQLLLETHSRLHSFDRGVFRPFVLAIFTVFVISFATTWSDFFLPALITTTAKTVRPFAVVLQMGAGQYHVDYALFAAGATISLVLTVALPAATLMPLWWAYRLRIIPRA